MRKKDRSNEKETPAELQKRKKGKRIFISISHLHIRLARRYIVREKEGIVSIFGNPFIERARARQHKEKEISRCSHLRAL